MSISPNTSSDWDAACTRLEQYFDSYHLSSRERVLRLTLEILEEARRQTSASKGESPLQATLQIALQRSDDWFASLCDTSPSHSGHSASANGRAVWQAIAGHRQWSEHFLAVPPPEDLLVAARKVSLQAGPGLEFSSLLRKEVNYGLTEDIARETWEKFSWSHVLRAFFLWTALFFAAWAYWLHRNP